MPETPVHLPADLVQRARGYGISVAEVAERALREAVAAAEARERAAPDVQEAARRAAERIGPPGTPFWLQHPAMSPAEQARSEGIRWARDKATAADMQYVAEYAGRASEFRAPDRLIDPLAPTDIEIARRYLAHPDRPGWRSFQAGVREVWEAIGPRP